MLTKHTNKKSFNTVKANDTSTDHKTKLNNTRIVMNAILNGQASICNSILQQTIKTGKQTYGRANLQNF